MKYIDEIDIKNKKVIVRFDYNVPIVDGQIIDTKKIDASFETLDYLVKNNCKIIILSHFGRVKEEQDKKLNSLMPVFNYIKSLNKYNIVFCAEPMGDMLETMSHQLNNGQIILVENTRFLDIPNKLESGCDVQLSMYWAHLAEIFINDAFATMHRNHASTYGLSQYMPSYCGFLVKKELENLSLLINQPKKPFVVLMGGAKLDDKIKLMYSLCEKADYILLGGGIANTFLLAAGYDLGSSLISDDSIGHAKAILKEYPDKIILPKDVITSPTFSDDIYQLKTLDEIVIDDVVGDLGSGAIANYERILSMAKTIFINGTIGIYEKPQFGNGTREILNYISKLDAIKIVGGGDAASSVKNYKLEDKMNYISTGGGATLTYIGEGNLICLEGIKESYEKNTY